MSDFKLDPQGFARLFLYIILGTLLLIVLPFVFRLVWWALNDLSKQSPEVLMRENPLALVFLTVIAGVVLGLIVRIARGL